jgi:hypothetical protein
VPDEPFTDEEVLATLGEDDPRFRALYDEGTTGNWSDADFELCCRIAKLAGDHPAQILRLWGESALGQRDKFERPDYQESTVRRAIARTQEDYFFSSSLTGQEENKRVTVEAPEPGTAQGDRAVERIKVTERARLEARAEFQRDQAAAAMRLPNGEDSRTLAELLQDNPEPTPQRIDRLFGRGHNFVLGAKYKSGKTTTTAHVAKAMIDGGQALGEFEVIEPLTGTLALWNVEMESYDMTDYARAVGLSDAGHRRFHVGNFKGFRIPLLDDQAAEWTVTWLRERETEMWVLDPWRVICAWSGVNEYKDPEVTPLLDRIDQIKREAGVRNVWINHHTGQNMTDRLRGAAALGDWGDVIALLVREGPDRFFSATGRGVDLPEGALRLVYEDELGVQPPRLFYTEGSRADLQFAKARDALVAHVTENPGCRTTDAQEAAHAAGMTDKTKLSQLVRSAIERDLIHPKRDGTAKLLYPGPAQDGAA